MARESLCPFAPLASVQTCPKCGGQGFVSKPPWVAGDQHSWLDSNTGGYLCPVCQGQRMIGGSGACSQTLHGSDGSVFRCDLPHGSCEACRAVPGV